MVAVGLAVLAPGLFVSTSAQPSGTDDVDLAKLSIEEMVRRAKACVRGMEERLAESFKLLEESIAANDVSATTARNEAITAMKGLVRLSEQNLLTLQQRAAERDRKRVEHEYVKITIACAKVREFYAQIKSATGIPVDLDLGALERKLEYKGSLPVVPDFPSTFSLPPSVPDAPVHASPYF